MYGGVATIGNGAGDQGTHFPSIVTVTLPAAIVPALLVLMPAPIHGQARACFNRRHKRSSCLSALADNTAVTVLLEAQWTDFTTRQIGALLTPTDFTAMLVLQVSKGTVLVTYNGFALLGPRPALTDLTVVGVSLEAEGAIQGTARNEAGAQLLPSFALTNATTILVQLEAIDTVFFSQSAVHQNLTGGRAYCDIRWFFTDRAALPRDLDGVQAALPAGCGHAVRVPIDALAERAVVLAPAVSVGLDLAIGIAASRVADWIKWVFTDWAALSFGHIVPVAVQLTTLGRETNGDSPLAPAKSTGIHPEHVSIIVFHAVKYAGWLHFVDALEDVAALARRSVSTRDDLGHGARLAHGETTETSEALAPCGQGAAAIGRQPDLGFIAIQGANHLLNRRTLDRAAIHTEHWLAFIEITAFPWLS